MQVYENREAQYLNVDDLILRESSAHHKICDEEFWYKYWKNRHQSYTLRSQLVAEMVENNKLNLEFILGTFKAGLNIEFTFKNKQLLESAFVYDNLIVIKLSLENGALISDKLIKRLVVVCVKCEDNEITGLFIPYMTNANIKFFVSQLIKLLISTHGFETATENILFLFVKYKDSLNYENDDRVNVFITSCIVLIINLIERTPISLKKIKLFLLNLDFMNKFYLLHPTSTIYNNTNFMTTIVTDIHKTLQPNKAQKILTKYNDMLKKFL
jgi:hypothetical protein